MQLIIIHLLAHKVIIQIRTDSPKQEDFFIRSTWQEQYFPTKGQSWTTIVMNCSFSKNKFVRILLLGEISL